MQQNDFDMRFKKEPEERPLSFVNPKMLKTHFQETKKDPYTAMKAKEVKPGDSTRARTLLFNVYDINMDATLTLKELFRMIKLAKVFAFLAGEDYKSTPYQITR